MRTVNKIKKQNRSLKISRKYSPRFHGKYVRVPELNLHGLWLNEAGFTEGERVQLNVSAGRIVIELQKAS